MTTIDNNDPAATMLTNQAFHVLLWNRPEAVMLI